MMSVVLALDTSTTRSAVSAWFEDQQIDLEVESNSHETGLGGLVSKACGELCVRPAQVSTVLYGTGPGSFTGLRIGKSFALGLVSGNGGAAYGVATPLAVVQAYGVEEPLQPGAYCVVGKGRKGSVIVTLFEISREHVLNAVVVEQLISVDEFASFLQDHSKRMGWSNPLVLSASQPVVEELGVGTRVLPTKGMNLFVPRQREGADGNASIEGVSASVATLLGSELRYASRMRAKTLLERRGW